MRGSQLDVEGRWLVKTNPGHLNAPNLPCCDRLSGIVAYSHPSPSSTSTPWNRIESRTKGCQTDRFPLNVAPNVLKPVGGTSSTSCCRVEKVNTPLSLSKFEKTD